MNQANWYACDYHGGILMIQEDTVAHAPTLWVPSGTYNNDTVVSAASDTPNAILYYTTNGTEPTQASAVFPTSGLTLSGTTTLKVKAFHPYLSPSSTTTGVYTFTVSTPTFSPGGTLIQPETGRDVSILSNTNNVVIYYTMDGLIPTQASTLYTGPIHLAVGPATINAIAFRANYQASTVATASWIQPTLPAPQINPSNGQIYQRKRREYQRIGPDLLHPRRQRTHPAIAGVHGPIPYHPTAVAAHQELPGTVTSRARRHP